MGNRLTKRNPTPIYSYDIALLYLQQVGYDLDLAVEAYKADEQWEVDHPMEAMKKGKSKATQNPRGKWISGTTGGLAGQI